MSLSPPIPIQVLLNMRTPSLRVAQVRFMSRIWLSALTAFALLTVAARSDAPDLTWEEPETVDTGVTDVSSPSGVSVVWADGLWHVVYEKSGDIYHRARSSGGWLPVERLTDDPATSRNPHISWLKLPGQQFIIHVVWEDDRTGHFEVWTRWWDGVQWSDEECLTCDENESSAPVIAGEVGEVLVAWEEHSGGQSSIQGRFWEDGAWQATQEISQSPASAMEPTAGADPQHTPGFQVSWTDDRHGGTEIYLRSYDSWLDMWYEEERLTDLPGDCRRPSLHVEDCCGDVVAPMKLVVFENDASGVAEVRGVCLNDEDGLSEGPISPDDGIPSASPSASGFAFDYSYCIFYGSGSDFLITWTDEVGSGVTTHQVMFQKQCLNLDSSQTDELTQAGESVSVVGAVEGRPEAGVMALWIEMVEGVPTLMAQRGVTLGCSMVGLAEDPAPSLLLAPEGVPENVFVFGDTCTGVPANHLLAGLDFSPEIDEAVTWDPLQDHPEVMTETNSEGEAIFAIRGGGCSQEGSVVLLCHWAPVWGWFGVRSPDVDGDCIVTNTDLDYVQAMLGSDDFCADLDGSGLVDPADVAIVMSTLSDHCSHITAAPEIAWESAEGPWLQLLPNPCRDASRIRLTVPRPGAVHVRIMDAAGRLVRDLGRKRHPGGITDIVWDTRDGSGHLVASGVYFVSASVEQRMLRRSVLVLR